MKVNAEKSKIMVGGADMGVIQQTGAWLCGVCRKRVQLNCAVHGVSEMGPSEVQWHKRQFQCRGEVPQVDPAEQEGLVVDREWWTASAILVTC